MRHVAVIFHRLGPYHRARLHAAAWACRVLAIELSAETSEYRWDKVSTPGTFRRITLFNGDSRSAPVGELRARLARVLDDHRPEVLAIPGWWDRAALLALQWCSAHATPAVLMSDSNAWDLPRIAWKEWVKSRVVKLYGAGLVGGQSNLNYIVALGMPVSRVFLGYDVVDNPFFELSAREARKREVEVRVRYGLPEAYFLASARFLEQKNLAGLLAAYARYRSLSAVPSGPNAGRKTWDLVLLGDGPLRSALELEIQRLGLNGHVHLPGFKQYADLPVYYGLARAFIHASTREPWGLVINEAMASGLPVVVSNRCGCVADLVRHGVNGFQFDPGKIDVLAGLMRKVSDLSAVERRAMGEGGERLVASWGPERFAEGLRQAAEAAVRAGAVRAGALDRLVLWCAVAGRGWRSEKTAIMGMRRTASLPMLR